MNIEWLEKKPPLVSVLVNNFNKGQYLKRCLDSIYNQTYSNLEIVFWDDNSTDNSIEIFNKWNLEREKKSGRSVRFGSTKQLHFSGLPGFVPLGVTRWLALQLCIGKYVAICDSDDFWSKYKLSRQLSYANNEAGCGWGLSFTDCNIIEGLVPSLKKYSEKYPVLYKGTFYKNLLTRYNFIPASTIIFNKEKLLRVLGSPTHYTSGEDYDWILKIAAKYCISYCPQVLSSYTVEDSSLTHSKRSSTRATWYEIDAVVSSYNREKRYKYSVFCHLVKLYAKLIYKQFVREKF